MAYFNVRRFLADPVTALVKAEDGEPVLILRNGKPVALLSPVDSEHPEGAIIAANPEMLASAREAEAAIKAGRGTSLSQVMEKLSELDDTFLGDRNAC
jgi:antitoxin (DNA-binding transcriptional repressor) of toxin-antitoxin stability system